MPLSPNSVLGESCLASNFLVSKPGLLVNSHRLSSATFFLALYPVGPGG